MYKIYTIDNMTSQEMYDRIAVMTSIKRGIEGNIDRIKQQRQQIPQIVANVRKEIMDGYRQIKDLQSRVKDSENMIKELEKAAENDPIIIEMKKKEGDKKIDPNKKLSEGI